MNLRKSLFAFAFMMLLATGSRAQTYFFYPAVQVGYSYQRVHLAEVSALAYWADDIKYNLISGAGISAGCGFGGYMGHFILAPRVSAQAHVFLLGGRVSYTHFTDFTRSANGLTFEGGINTLGIFYLYAGGTLCLDKEQKIPIEGFTLSCGFNIFFDTGY